ncbi:M23 family metallopeptidase [Gaoshiqia sp. Z1-71]|uniref:M23 family metallopeptidase n=1 Tax=Gaoshiqia hydrogeniformans TaxID=3290090 RepID=UPI003BF7D0E3
MKLWTLFFAVILCKIAYPQAPEAAYFADPVKIPLSLSGNFGELRSNHFHSGIDIRTEGRTGLPVYAAADGEVSRIFVSPSGFGLALYIDHPNGTTTVYGHLDRLNDELAAYTKAVQYEKESFSVDIPVSKGKFTVNKNELIAYSGNSGSSGGPHLHFEIRDTKTQQPVNPLLKHFRLHDDTAPKILSVMLYPLSDDAHVYGKADPYRMETVFYNGAYHLKNNPVIPVYGEIGFSLQTLDYLNGSWSKCGVYSIELAIDNKTVYLFKLDKLSFDETRYLNAHIDYGHFQRNNRRLHKNWVEPGNKLNNYPVLVNRGISRMDDGKIHTVDYLVKDVNGNESRFSFKVQSKQSNVGKIQRPGIAVNYDKPLHINQEGLEANFKAGTFYSDFILDYQLKQPNKLYYSPIYKLHNGEIPVHQYFELRIKAVDLPKQLEDKALIAAVDEKTGQKWALGGQFSHGWVEASIRQLGSFAVVTDTIPPVIKPINIQNRSIITDKNKISFIISDDFSGISSYRGEIDGQWVLFEYDAKNNLLEYRFDSSRMAFNKKHQLKLVVSDAKNNQTTYEAGFYR